MEPKLAIIIIPFVVCIVGLCLYLWSPNPKVTNIGDRMFWVGLFITLFKL